jgi:hypothetical protein
MGTSPTVHCFGSREGIQTVCYCCSSAHAHLHATWSQQMGSLRTTWPHFADQSSINKSAGHAALTWIIVRSKVVYQQRPVLCNCKSRITVPKKLPHTHARTRAHTLDEGELNHTELLCSIKRVLFKLLLLFWGPYQTREYGCALHVAKQDLKQKKKNIV